jgi:hypothetical protein
MDVKANPISKIALNDLPEELWIDVIRESSTDHLTSISYTSIDRLLTLTLVSRDWRNRIQSIPLFWTDLVIDEDTQDIVMKLHLCAYLSKNSLLALHLCSVKAWREVAHLILSLKSRIRIISVHKEPLTIDRSFETTLQQILNQLSPLPQISSLILDGTDSDALAIGQFVSNHPSLVDITGIPLALPILLCDSREWRRFSTNQTPEEVVYHFRDLKSLQEIIFVPPQGSILQDTPKPCSSSPVPALDSLSGIRITTFTLDLLDQLALSITFLEVHSTVETLRNALPVFERMELLDTLSVRLSKELPWNPAHSIFSLADRPLNQKRNKRRLSTLNISHYIPIDRRYSDEVVSLCRDFRHMMPSVVQLQLNLWKFEDAALFVDHGFPDVQSISIYCLTHIVGDYFQQGLWDLPTSLQSLSVDCSLSAFELLNPKGIRHLNLENNEVIPEYVDLGKWSSLCTLSMEGFSMRWSQNHFPFLTRISMDLTDGDFSITEICWHLSQNIDQCPALTELCLHGILEWDILLIMLEERNIHPTQPVSLIQHLEIPTPCLALQGPIIQLLRGHSVSRPSNFDISWQGNAEVFYDLTMYV